MRERKLRVRSNPYHVLDHDGRPAGVVPTDAAEHTPYFDPHGSHPENPRWEPRRYVGARLHKDTKVIASGPNHEHAQDTVWEFSSEAEELPETKYYLQCLKDGSLLAADAKTAKRAGFKGFEEPDTVLACELQAANDKWTSQYPDEEPPQAAKFYSPKKEEEEAIEAQKKAEAEKKKAAAPTPAHAPEPKAE